MVKKTKGEPAEATKFYVNLGRRVREARLTTAFTLKEFAAKLGISYQQMEKYEDGKNRVTVDRMMQIVELTGMPIDFFVDGINRQPTAPRRRQASTLLELIRLWDKIPTPKMRSHIMAMIREAAG